MTPDMQVVEICQQFGWTYKEYFEQPMFFIELIKAKLEIEAEEAKRQFKRIK